MKRIIFFLMVACIVMAMEQTADAVDKKITHEQIEEVMKGFKAKLQNDLASNKKVLTKYATWLAAFEPSKGDAESWKKKTSAIVAAIKVNDQAGLEKAINCKACHNIHKE
tara:strand:- start:1418 stop:1747 length:330 start_codon:yes stop_codon:yes gene_type:complete